MLLFSRLTKLPVTQGCIPGIAPGDPGGGGEFRNRPPPRGGITKCLKFGVDVMGASSTRRKRRGACLKPHGSREAPIPAMMLTKTAPLLLLLLVGFGACEEREVSPCKKGRECFSYTLVCNGSGYEARLYPPSVWVATRINDGSAFLPALIHGFWRLFRYIQGKNAAGVHIPMTGPVLTRVRDDPESREFEIYFMLPEAFRGDPPAPSEETVFVERLPELRVYARVFGGWMTDANRLAQLQYLDGQLSAHGRPLQAGRHYTAGYNSPMEIFNRRNEVWREAEGELSCSPTLEE